VERFPRHCWPWKLRHEGAYVVECEEDDDAMDGDEEIEEGQLRVDEERMDERRTDGMAARGRAHVE